MMRVDQGIRAMEVVDVLVGCDSECEKEGRDVDWDGQP